MPQVGKFIMRKGVTPDIAEEMSPKTEMGADICVQTQPGLNDKTTVSMKESQLWRVKMLPQLCYCLTLCHLWHV